MKPKPPRRSRPIAVITYLITAGFAMAALLAPDPLLGDLAVVILMVVAPLLTIAMNIWANREHRSTRAEARGQLLDLLEHLADDDDSATPHPLPTAADGDLQSRCAHSRDCRRARCVGCARAPRA